MYIGGAGQRQKGLRIIVDNMCDRFGRPLSYIIIWPLGGGQVEIGEADRAGGEMIKAAGDSHPHYN